MKEDRLLVVSFLVSFVDQSDKVICEKVHLLNSLQIIHTQRLSKDCLFAIDKLCTVKHNFGVLNENDHCSMHQ